MKNQVVATAMGIVSPIGTNIEDFCKSLCEGTSGVRSIRGSLAPADFPVPYVAWIARESLPPTQLYAGRDSEWVLKSWLMAEQATRQAVSGLSTSLEIDAVVFGTADGVSFEMVESLIENKEKTCWPTEQEQNVFSSESSLYAVKDTLRSLGFKDIPNENLISLNSACATGNQAIGIAMQGIREGRWKRCLVGGVDARCELSNLLNFYLLGALTTDDVPPEKASRPFSKDRSGFVRGEGAGVMILESREEAEKRKAPILGIISGYGCTSDAYRLTDGREDALSVIQAMQTAVQDSGLSLEDIDYISAHGTSTPLNDRLESFAIKKLFKERAAKIPISSLKSQIGHSTIAASMIEGIANIIMLNEQFISPTLNFTEADPGVDLDFVPNHSREASVNHILSNSFGFGGQNTCTVFSRFKA